MKKTIPVETILGMWGGRIKRIVEEMNSSVIY
jgi:transcription antitermination factor NusA-like protein